MTAPKINSANEAAIDWLLGCAEPAIRYLTRRDLLGEEAAEDEKSILDGPMVTALLDGQRLDGAFPGHGWSSTMWRLVSLVELAIPPDEPRAIAGADWFLDRVLEKPHHRGRPTIIDGLHRFCSNREGHALVIAARLGLTDDPRVHRIAEALIEWQWPDGGWNCHRNASGRRSSFQESLAAAWGLHEYAEDHRRSARGGGRRPDRRAVSGPPPGLQPG